MMGMAIDDIITISLSLILGIFLICFSRHKGSFEKTANVEGVDAAKKKFRIIELCGYILAVGAVIYAIL